MNEAVAATAKALDFTNVKDGGGGFNKKRQPAGDYKAQVTKVQDAPTKKGNEPQWLFTIQVGTGTYPYYCKLTPDQLWKLRNILQAAGLVVPKARVRTDPNKIVGRIIGVTLDDDEYDNGDKVMLQSVVSECKPVSEVSPGLVDPEDAEATDDDEDEEEPTPPKRAKPKPAPEPEEDDEEEEEEPTPPKKAKPKPKPAPVDDDDEEDEEDDTPPPPKKAKPKPAPVDDDDLEELEIDL